MKLAMVLVGLVLSLVALAAPASAKGVRLVRIEIAGPGLDEPISLRISRTPGGVAPLPWDLLPGEHGFVSKVPEGELGPGYLVMSYTRWITDDEPVMHRQTVFPFAQGAPVTYTDPYRRPMTETEWIEEPGGWSRLPDRFEEWFVNQGVPRPRGTVGTRDPWVMQGLAVLTALIVLGGLGLLRRRSLVTAEPDPA